MLTLTLKRDEVLQLGPDIAVRVERITPGKVRLVIQAPRPIKIDHLIDGKPRQRKEASACPPKP